MIITVLICVAVILLGASTGKPLGWLAIIFAVMAFLCAVGPSLGPWR